MFGISGEHLLVLLVILLIFGPKRLPDLGSSLGRTLRNFKDAMNPQNEEARKVIQTAQTQPTTAIPATPAAQNNPVEMPPQEVKAPAEGPRV
jgi:sec-independent protein translocase protein TatA